MRRLVLSLPLLLLLAAPAGAHEHGRIYLGAPRATLGDTLAVRGEKLSKATTFKLELRGALASYPLGQAKTDAKGAFTATFRLPADAKPGDYTVVVVAPDGDVSARANLALVAAPAAPVAATPAAPKAAPADGQAEAMAGMPGMTAGSPHATAAPMDLPRHAGTGQWIAIGALTLVCFGFGAWLLRPAAA